MEHFKLIELVDQLTFVKMGEDAWKCFDPDALQMLDDMATFFKQDNAHCVITVNNWAWGGQFQWRGARNANSPDYTPNSMHSYDATRNKLCGAFDCDIRGYTAAQARRIIVENKDNDLLKGIMRLEDKVSWVHLDNKPTVNRIHLFKV